MILQCDEMWSFVGRKRNKLWIWLAFDADSREVVALVVGDRGQTTAQALWDALPPLYRRRHCQAPKISTSEKRTVNIKT